MTRIVFILFVLSLTTVCARNGATHYRHKAQIASDLAWGYKDRIPDSSLYYARAALKYARLAKDNKLVAYSLSDIGNYYKRKEDYPKARSYYFRSLLVRKKLRNKEDIGSIYNQLGLMYRQWERYDSAVYYFSQGLKLLPNGKYLDLRMKLQDGLGMTLIHLGDYRRALHAVNTSRQLSEQLGDSLSIAQSWQNTGTINQYLGNSGLALENYQKAGNYYRTIGNLNGALEMEINRGAIFLVQGRYDEAEKLLLNAEKSSIELGFLDNSSTILLTLARLYDVKEPWKALNYYKRAYSYSKNTNKITTRIEAALGLAACMVKSGTPSANEFLEELQQLIFEENFIEYAQPYYELLAQLYRSKGNYEQAFQYSQKAAISQEKLYTEAEKANDLLTSMEIADREKKLLEEQLKRSKTETKLRETELFIFGGVIIFLVVLVFLLAKNQRVKREKKMSELRYEAEINLLLHESELKFYESTLELETDIREKIGRDLHDELGTKLSVAQMKTDSLADSLALDIPVEIEDLKAISLLLETSCTALRTISHDLVGEDLRKNSLNSAIANICKAIPDRQLRIRFSVTGEVYPVPMKIKRNVWATVNLLISNVIKHSNASNATLQIFYHSDSLNLELEDDGIGFSDLPNDIDGIGLKNARKRIDEVGGTFDISSQINNGTSVSISIPL